MLNYLLILENRIWGVANMMRDDETCVSYYAARQMKMLNRVKNAWKKEVCRRRVSRQTLAMCLKDWRKGEHDLIVDKDIVLKEWF